MTIFPAYWAEFAHSHQLIGTSACLSESDDLSGMGADLQFLTEAQATEELTECWPGIGVAPNGYVPVAWCSVVAATTITSIAMMGQTAPCIACTTTRSGRTDMILRLLLLECLVIMQPCFTTLSANNSFKPKPLRGSA
jgi:hypothetical protein